jgi:hypothetical protein
LLTSFTAPGESVSLGVGDTLEARFDFSLTGALASTQNILRFAFLDSRSTGTADGNTRVSADNHGVSNTAFSNYKGYMMGINPLPPANSANTVMVFSRRDAANTALVTTVTDVYTDVGRGTSSATGLDSSGGLAAATLYTGVFTLARASDAAMSLTFTILNGTTGATVASLTVEDKDPAAWFSFDTFVIAGMRNNGIDGITLENMTITLTSVPEPRSTAIGIGFSVTLALLAARFRRATK